MAQARRKDWCSQMVEWTQELPREARHLHCPALQFQARAVFFRAQAFDRARAHSLLLCPAPSLCLTAGLSSGARPDT
eukprot:3471996-Alexandrium_andersonii.AAC.1